MSRDALYVFAYDISENKVRRKIADILEHHGTRVQGSVFEVRTTQIKAENLLKQLDRQRLPGDSIRMYCLPEDARQRCRISGGAPIGEATEFWLL